MVRVCAVLIIANKTDLPGSVGPEGLTKALGLDELDKNRKIHIQPAIASKGQSRSLAHSRVRVVLLILIVMGGCRYGTERGTHVARKEHETNLDLRLIPIHPFHSPPF